MKNLVKISYEKTFPMFTLKRKYVIIFFISKGIIVQEVGI